VGERERERERERENEEYKRGVAFYLEQFSSVVVIIVFNTAFMSKVFIRNSTMNREHCNEKGRQTEYKKKRERVVK